MCRLAIAMVDLHRAHDSGQNERVAAILNNPEYGGLISQLLGSGGIELVDDDDENDPDYHPPGQEGDGRPGDSEDEVEDEEVIVAEDIDNDEEDDDDDDEEEDVFGSGWGRSRSQQHSTYHHDPVTEPQPGGLSLLYSGEFGRIKHQTKTRNKDNNIARILQNRGAKLRPSTREDLTTDVIPNSNGTAVVTYQANAYVGQYSSDSSFYYTCVRDFRLHIYDANAPITPREPYLGRRRTPYQDDSHLSCMKVIKTIHGRPGGWTITDSHLSPDNQRMIYASVTNLVYMTNTIDSSVEQHAINFADPRSGTRYSYGDPYGVWSCKFSADGNEIIAGGTEMVFVYDLLADKRTVKIKAHADDINSCCWADTASGNVLVSASDDTFLKVWDRRSLGSSPKPSGVLMGHTEGITYVSAKGDGRYLISNGKDQKLRLWDLRKMRSNLEFEQWEHRDFGIPSFDYRRGSYPRPLNKAHPMDCSVMQYTGHDVLRTLIRCHFSPAETTGQQYIYSGSANGKIHIWSLDGRVVEVLDRSGTLPMSYHPSEPQPPQLPSHSHRVCVRDVSWHSQQPILMSAGWLGSSWGDSESSVIARHEWKGLSKLNYNLADYTVRQQSENAERRNRLAFMPGTYLSDILDDDLY
ncbi:WD40-repeat-containing domain protein [Irpex rosettiformis]|uniref:WD40-repeat-containing domain protein n=1 Tax=Irpex rosettiformis TaxID=378272 RepID=A0ACB8UIP8_9APHY|nr:WD40-repeat-containing domain protein [Irpex rosettiformis]